MSSNGEVRRALTLEERLDVLIESQADIATQLEQMSDRLDELSEMVANLTIENDGFGLLDEN